jgi:hypothetical protein
LSVLFSFSLISPAIFASDDSNLPACCRRGGKHHCAMNVADQGSSSSGPSLQADGQKCPNFPKSGAAPAYSKIAFLQTFQTVSGLVLSHPAGQTQTEARYRISFSRSRQKRGPPALLS